MKKWWLGIIALLIVGLGVGGFFLVKSRLAKSVTQERAKIQAPVNTIDLTLRPYVSLVPRDDLREVKLTLHDVKKDARIAEYELEYQAGTLLQGAFGRIDLATETLPVSKDLLLGSCSAGGKCTYHEDVKGGTLKLSFENGETYAIKVEWNFIPTQDAGGKFASRDAKFQLDAGKLLNTSKVVIVMQTSGLPEKVEGNILAGPYGVYPSKSLPKGKAELTMRLNEEAETATIMGWDGSKWVEFKTAVDGKTATATVDLLSVYVAVASAQ